ncbi:unnamed protein product [Rotaria magnacalcarata]|uniref:Uncharacterized protein n=1 Tax=Rotaria magnacalcarata TaxID=392030 RepID=A0A8S2K1T9_9BILA|nr:unnamed protein product [Rotaria magnacalcarata]
MFSDEKIFTRNGYFNPKNDVIWEDSWYDANEAGGYHETEKFPVSLMVALGATWNGLTKPYFFSKNERLNGKTYHETLLPFYKEEGDRLFGHKIWGFHQDGANCHTDDDDSLSFTYMSKNDICYAHIEKLTIELKTLDDLHQLLTDSKGIDIIMIQVA